MNSATLKVFSLEVVKLAAQSQLDMGIEVEREHKDTIRKIRDSVKGVLTMSNEEIFKCIAKDHLKEFPNYYSELKKMEDKLKSKED